MPRFFRFAIKSLIISVFLRSVARRNIRAGAPRMAVIANDYVGHWIQMNGWYELETLQPAIAFAQALNDNQIDTVIDVGANIGNHSVYFQNFANRVVAVEANPEVFKILSLNCEKYPAITLINIALGDHEGVGQIVLVDSSNEGTGQFVTAPLENEDSSLLEKATKITKLDNLVKTIPGHIDLIKIDVEGFEEKVLLGSIDVLKNTSPIIMFEYYVANQGGGAQYLKCWKTTDIKISAL